MVRFPQIAVATRAFRLPVRRAIRDAAEIGADGVQFEIGSELPIEDMTESARRQLLREMGELGLTVATLHLPVNRPLSDGKELESQLHRIKQSLQLAFQLRCRVVTFRVGRLPERESTDAATLLGALNEAARYANHVGAFPSITVSATSIDEIAAILQQVNDGPIGINLDPALLVTSGLSPVSVFRELAEFVNHITIRDAVSDLDGTFIEVPVGRGDVAWDELLALIQEAEFQGWLTVVRTQGDDKSGDLSRAVRFIRTVCAE